MSADGTRLGRVVGVRGDVVIVRVGPLLRRRRVGVPIEFAHLDDGERTVRITVSRSMLSDAPAINGSFDERAVAAHYGLA